MAHKKAAGSTKNGRDSNPKYRGVKHFGGEQVKAGAIIILQCGTRYHAGKGVGLGKNYTIYARHAGEVVFVKRGKRGNKKVFVHVVEKAA